MHSVETVTARQSREDKYSMIDRGEQYSCVPLTSPRWLLPAPDLSHLSWLPKETDSSDIILFTLGIKTKNPVLHLCNHTRGWSAHWSGRVADGRCFGKRDFWMFITPFFSPHWSRPTNIKTNYKVIKSSPVPQSCRRCIDSLIVHLTFNNSLLVTLPH